MNALGMNEVMSIPTGFLVCDAMLKAADVTLISSGCVCAGKYYTVVSGEVAAVRAAVEAGRELAEEMDLYFLDNYNHSAVTEETLETYLPDGTHPNEAGRLVLAKELMYFIEKELAGAQILP